MRHVEQHTEPDPFKLTPDRKEKLRRWCETEITDALSARFAYDTMMRENMRLYEGVPQKEFLDFPFEGAPNIEFNISAIAVDTIYAQGLDLIFSMTPSLVQAIATNKAYSDYERPIQRLIDHGTSDAGDFSLRIAANNAILDDVKHGTGIYYIPWTERVKKTDIFTITDRGPRIRSWPIEDFLVPGGTEELESADWVALRMWLTPSELNMRANVRGWDISGAKETTKTSYIRTVREAFGNTRQSTERRGRTYEVWMIFANVDVDEDGVEQDLLVFYDVAGNSILKAVSMPYDYWPVEAMRYQIREHLFWGVGVPEMTKSFQHGLTDFLNNWLANSFLANMRGFKGPHGALGTGDTIRWRPGKFHAFNQPDQVEQFALADVYPSAPLAVQTLVSFAERRTGANDISSPRPSNLLGTRTPGITALSMMQQANRRFTPAFDEMRMATSSAVKQCLFRYQERLLAGDKQVEQYIGEILGPEDAQMALEVLKDQNFDNAMKMELTATSATINKMQERQDAIQLAGFLGGIYDKVVQLMGIASTQGIAEPMRETAQKVAGAMSEIIKRTVNTFDQIRDPEKFILDVEDEINALPGLPTAGVGGLIGLLGGAPGANGNGAGPGMGGAGTGQ